MITKFVNRLLDPESTASAKRFVTLLMTCHIVITSFLVSFFVFYLIIYTPKGSVNKDLLDVLKVIFEYDFYIILAGLSFITTDNLAQMLLEKAKATVAGNVAVGAPTSEGTVINTKAETIKTDNIETVNTKTVVSNKEPEDAK